MTPKPVDRSLLHAVEEAESNGLAGRGWSRAALFLSLCQACPAFTGRDCVDFPGEQLLGLLLDGSRQCPRWVEIHGRSGDEP